MKKVFTGRKTLAAVAAGVALVASSIPLVTSAASAASVTQITVWGSGGDQSTEQNGIQYAVAQYNKTYAGKYHANLKFITNISTVQETSSASDLGTVMEGDGPTLSYLAYSGKIAPISSYVSANEVKAQSTYIQGQDTYKGQLYAMATINGTLTLYGNVKLLADAGITACGTNPTTASCYPSDWANAWTADEFSQVLSKLAANSTIAKLDNGKVWASNVAYGGEYGAYGFLPILNSAGSTIINSKGMANMNTTAVYNALSQWASWQTTNDQTASGEGPAFAAGDMPLLWGGHWQLPGFESPAAVAADGVVGIPLPNFGEGAKDGAGSNVWEISSAATTAQKQAAGAFLNIVSSTSFQDLYTYGNGTTKNGVAVYGDGAIPANPAAFAKDPTVADANGVLYWAAKAEADACPAGVIRTNCYAVPRPVTPAYPGITTAISTLFDSLNTQGAQGAVSMSTIQSLVATADDTIDSDIFH
jgi:multiple sugar transport system substrate-binding protein